MKQSKLSAQDKARNYRLMTTYGITLEEYEEKLKQQNGRCAICGTLPKTKRLAVDHRHEKDSKGKQVVGDRTTVRGLLCLFCNKYILGGIERRISIPAREIIRGLVAYMLEYQLKGDDKTKK